MNVIAELSCPSGLMLRTASPSECIPLDYFCKVSEVPVGRGCQCSAHPSTAFEFPIKSVSLLCVVSNLLNRSGLTNKLFLKDRYLDVAKQAWTCILAVSINSNLPHREIMWKIHRHGVGTIFPRWSFGTRYLTYPFQHINWAIFFVFHWFCHKSKRMIASPILSLFLESVDNELVNFFFVHNNNYLNLIIKEMLTFILAVRIARTS